MMEQCKGILIYLLHLNLVKKKEMGNFLKE